VEQSHTSEADSHAIGHVVLSFTWETNIHKHIHKSRSLDPFLNQMNPMHTLEHFFFKMHLNSILPSTTKSSK
jgi:hypothetical protein